MKFKSQFSIKLVSTCCISALAAALIPPVRAQSSQTQPPATLHVNTRLIEFDVLVQDSHGQPVTGLTQKDFAVTDEGQGMPISFFSVLSPSTSPSESQIAVSSQQGPVFTNTPSAHPDVPANLTIILVDALNTPFSDMIYSTQQLVRYLSQLKPSDHVAIYTLGSKFGVLQDFTTNDAALVEAVKGYQASNASAPDAKAFLKQIRVTAASGGPNEATVAKIEKAFSNIDDAIPLQLRATSVSITLAALREIALHVSGVPGRKNLLWLSGGFPLVLDIKGESTAALSGADLNGASGNPLGFVSGGSALEMMRSPIYLEQLQRTLRLLESANIAVYPVDARGLVAPTSAADPRFANTNTGGPEDTAGASIEGMEAIADSTGGRAFFNTNAIATSLGTAQSDAQYSYLIGYYPKTEWDGKFHKVHIQVSQPGVHVHARQGYFAIAPPKSPEEDRKLALATAADGSLDSTEIPFTVKTNPMPSSDGKASNYSVLISVNGGALQFTQEGDHWDAHLELIIVQRDAVGKPVARTGNNMSWVIPAAQYQDALNGILTNITKLTLSSGAAEVRFIVRDPNSRELGSITIPVEELSPASAPVASK